MEDESSITVEVGTEATASKASRRQGGSCLPRFSARRRMPRQAFWLKKYRGGTAPVSKMSDKEDTTAALGYSAVLSVQHAPADRIVFGHPEHHSGILPAFGRDRYVHSGKRGEEALEVGPSGAGKYAGHILPEKPLWMAAVSEADELQGKVASGVGNTGTLAGDRERLAGCSADEYIEGSIFFSLNGGEVAGVGDGRVTVREHGRGEGVDLREGHRDEAQRVPGDRGGLNAGGDGEEPHAASFLSASRWAAWALTTSALMRSISVGSSLTAAMVFLMPCAIFSPAKLYHAPACWMAPTSTA
jgi:hypothetical protein